VIATGWAAVFAFAFGCAVGSFLNVVRYRLPRKADLVYGRSACPGCSSPIAWYDNVPIVSFIILRGKCRRCGWKIPWVYPVIEVATGTAFLLVWLDYAVWGNSVAAAIPGRLLVTSLLVACAGIDYDLRIIPDKLTLPGVALGLALSPTLLVRDSLAASFAQSVLGAVVGGGSLLAIALAYRYLRKIEGMGGGDIKMMAMVGAFLGWAPALLTIFVGSLLGGLVGVVLMARSKQGLKTSVPFGVFLAPAAIAVMIWGGRALRWYAGVLGSSG
jgi:leader peptidase (prepilin peptidase)/N-methyltransferase